jgi:GDP-L-fucose synthase
LIRKIHEAKIKNQPSIVMWGTGEPRREFLHADDLADACFFLMQKYNERGLINVGIGEDLTINELANLIIKIVGFEGRIEHDTSKPDGTPRKLLDVSRLSALGWKAKISLEEGIRNVYHQFLESAAMAV